MKKKEIMVQFIKFGIVGGLNTLIAYGLTNLRLLCISFA